MSGGPARVPPVRRAMPVAVLAILGLAAPVAAQRDYTTALVPPTHWSADAIRRLDGMGLVHGGYDISQRAPTQDAVATILAAAALADTAHRSLADVWLRRFVEEFGRAPAGGVRSLATGSAATVGWADRQGALATGWGYGFYYPGADWNQPTPRPDDSDPFLEGTVQVGTTHIAARATVSHPVHGEALRELYGIGRLGSVVAWAGRREYSWGPAVGPGIVMNGGRYDSFGGRTDPFELPWIFRHIGAITLDAMLGMEDFEHTFEDAAVLATRFSVAPHDRLHLGVTRAAFFGGEGNTDVDLFAIFSVLIGKHAGDISELDNQVVAVDASFALPTERWLPARTYVEWGFEDSAGAFRDVPGVLVGIDLPSLPGLPGLALAVERTSFAGTCCGNPIWYRHSTFWDGWTQDGRPLGHPLGGHGHEWAVRSRLHLNDARLRVNADAFVRDRGNENLYADVRNGSSTGGTIGLEADIKDGLRLLGEGLMEDGEGWREVRLMVALRAFL